MSCQKTVAGKGSLKFKKEKKLQRELDLTSHRAVSLSMIVDKIYYFNLEFIFNGSETLR